MFDIFRKNKRLSNNVVDNFAERCINRLWNHLYW